MMVLSFLATRRVVDETQWFVVGLVVAGCRCVVVVIRTWRQCCFVVVVVLGLRE